MSPWTALNCAFSPSRAAVAPHPPTSGSTTMNGRPVSGVRPADERGADRREAAGRQPAVEVRGEAAQDQVVEPDPHLVVDRRTPPRRDRVEDRAGPREHASAARSSPRCRRRRGRRRFRSTSWAAIVEPSRDTFADPVLLRVVAQVDDELVGRDPHLDVVDGAAVLLLGERERPAGKGGEQPPRRPLAVVVQALERARDGVEPVARDEPARPGARPAAPPRSRPTCRRAGSPAGGC